MAEITEPELLELKDAFDLYTERSADGKVDFHELGKLFLSLGQKMSDEEMRKMLSDLGWCYFDLILDAMFVYNIFVQRLTPTRRSTSPSSSPSWHSR